MRKVTSGVLFGINTVAIDLESFVWDMALGFLPDFGCGDAAGAGVGWAIGGLMPVGCCIGGLILEGCFPSDGKSCARSAKGISATSSNPNSKDERRMVVFKFVERV
ncbi:MAG TPA: hypothetical protein VGO69_12855 [Pyrinomonadaceae bacterium]|nr:hypothetical protein [Pyrinomonadaceae bacterium]